MKKLSTYFLIIVLGLLNLGLSSMTKAYIGSEEGQVILGIESLSAKGNGVIGGEIKTALARQGIEVNGTKYGYLPHKMEISFVAGGGDELSVAKLKNTVTYVHSQPIKFYRNTDIQLISGQGPYLLYQ